MDTPVASSPNVARLFHEATAPPSAKPARAERLLHVLAGVALAFGVPASLAGFALRDPLALAIAAALLGTVFVLRDVTRARVGALSPITLYAFAWTLTSIANAIALVNRNTSDRPLYYLYAVDEHLPLAMMISWLGLVIPVLAYKGALRSPLWRAVGALMPRVNGRIPRQRLLGIAGTAGILGIGANATAALPSLGSLTALVYMLPHLAAFTLARAGTMWGWRTAVWVGFVIAVIEAVRALMSAYLRSDILSPIFAYAVGVLMGHQSLRALRSAYMLPVYAIAVPFILYFAAFAEVRSESSGGVPRLGAMAEVREVQEQSEIATRHNVISRLSSINQLTQVARVVQEDGYYDGETLEYLTYAWIPRFLWPEKPTIAKGAWFALRIGQARMFEGRITNSVNMTIPGELYLNFGWIGVVVGTALFGVLLALFWTTTGFWIQRENVLGAAFGFYLLWVGLGAGADLQILVTLSAIYALFVAASLALPNAPLDGISVRRRGALRATNT